MKKASNTTVKTFVNGSVTAKINAKSLVFTLQIGKSSLIMAEKEWNADHRAEFTAADKPFVLKVADIMEKVFRIWHENMNYIDIHKKAQDLIVSWNPTSWEHMFIKLAEFANTVKA
jgi:hypothetical protein